MKMTKFKRCLSLILFTVLLAAMAQFAIGCGEKEILGEGIIIEDGKTYGEGAKSFIFEVVDKDGNSVSCTVKTDKTKVGEALMDNKLIKGEVGDYGLYIKTINGITADYDVNQTYWAFYIGGEYATASADMTDIVEGTTYTFKVEG